MSKTRRKPELATLQRFTIDPNHFPDDLFAWTLPFPFMNTAYRVRDDLRRCSGKDKLNFPWRRLNNALMAVSPLVHGFEWDNPLRRYQALHITTQANEQKPNPESIFRVIDAWMNHWIAQHTAKDATAQKRIQSMWRDATSKLPDNFCWQPITATSLLGNDKTTQSLRYQAIPSLIAALLHGKETKIEGKTIQWLKVQEAGNKKLSLLGMIENEPIYANYQNLTGFGRPKNKADGEGGYFAFKIEFRLEKQTGRSQPWLYLSLHVQRYGSEPLKYWNKRRNPALLVGLPVFRLDNLPTEAALTQLPIKRKDGSWEWAEYLADVLELASLEQLSLPDDILAGDPKKYWALKDSTARLQEDRYYLIHAEGYQYERNERIKGHAIETGVSMGDMKQIIPTLLQMLPMLSTDAPLTADSFQKKTPKSSPPALKQSSDWPTKTSRLNRPFKEEELAERRDFQQILADAIAMQTGERPLTITIFHHNPDTKIGIEIALREAIKLNDGDTIPANICIQSCQFDDATLLEAFNEDDKIGAKRQAAHQKRVTQIRNSLKTKPIAPSRPMIGIVELRSDGKKPAKGQLGTRSAIRHAFAQEGITTQFILPLSMKRKEDGQTVFKQGNSINRAKAAAYEALMRHVGLLFGSANEIYRTAGVQEGIDIIGFYLKKTQNNICFPLAVKLTANGRITIRFPTQDNWLPYVEAAPILGQLFAQAWPDSYYTYKRVMKKSSTLCQDVQSLSQFVQQTLSHLPNPTLAIIEADKWRNGNTWPQLQVDNLATSLHQLNFEPHGIDYARDLPELDNLLSIVRMRSGRETPQYVTDTDYDFQRIYGAIEQVGDAFHYFSIGEHLQGARLQREWSQEKVPYAHESMLGDKASGIAYKHPQVVEFMPFFVHPTYDTSEGKTKLCRIPHLLRFSPHWQGGNTILPYPMHLAKTLIEDQLCILVMDD